MVVIWASFGSSNGNRMEMNNHKGKEKNWMYLSMGIEWKGKEWNEM